MSDPEFELDLNLRADLETEGPRVRRSAFVAFVLGLLCAGVGYLYVGRRRRAWLVVPALTLTHGAVATLVAARWLPIWAFAAVPLTLLLARAGTAVDAAFATQDLAPDAVPRWRDYAAVGAWTWAFTLVILPLLGSRTLTMNGSAMQPAAPDSPLRGAIDASAVTGRVLGTWLPAGGLDGWERVGWL